MTLDDSPGGPMYALAILRYRKPLEEVQKHVDAHRAYCQGRSRRSC